MARAGTRHTSRTERDELVDEYDEVYAETTREDMVVHAIQTGDRQDGTELRTEIRRAEKLHRRLDELASAVDRSEDGVYGVCEVCGEAIEDDRVAAHPATARCRAHAAR